MSSETPGFLALVQINENCYNHICQHYERTFQSNRGLNQHLRACKQNIGREYEPAKEKRESIEVSANTTRSTAT